LASGIEGTLTLLALLNVFGEALPGALRDAGVEAYLPTGPQSSLVAKAPLGSIAFFCELALGVIFSRQSFFPEPFLSSV